MNIFQRLNEVRKVVDYAKKEKAVESYKAVTHDQITALTRDHFVEHGIIVVPRRISGSTVLTGTQTSRGTPFIRMEAVYEFDFVNMDEPQDRLTVVIEAHAIDQGDKAPGKVLSYAKKYAILKVLDIESGEDDEGRPEQFKPKVKAGIHTATDGAFEGLKPARQKVVTDTHTAIVDALNEERDMDALGLYQSITDTDEKVALWGLLSKEQKKVLRALDEKAKNVPG